MRVQVEGFPDYFVGSDGMVFSFKKDRMRQLSPVKSNNGYLKVTLSREGKESQFLVHRLVASAFLQNPLGKRTVNHKNGNKHDNRACNLEWATYSENHRHSFESLGRESGTKGKRGWLCANSKSVCQLSKDGEVLNTFGSAHEAYRATGINNTCIGRVCNGTQNTAGGYLWRFVDGN